jgi:O-antigen ligase
MNVDAKNIFLLFFITGVTAAVGMMFAKAPTSMVIAITAGMVIAVISFFNTELALYILIISMLLGPQITVGGAELVPGRGRGGVTLRFDDFLLVVIGLSWFFKTAVNKELGLFPGTRLNRAIGYYFAVCLASTLIGQMFGRVRGLTGIFFVLKYFEYFIVFFMAVSQIKEKRQIERFLAAILIVSFIVSLVAIYQIPAGGRVSAPFEGERGEPNTLGGYLVLMMSIVLGLLLNYGSRTLKIVLGILLFFMLIALGATLSRSSWVSLIPMTLALIYFSRKKAMIVVPLALVIVIAPFVIPNNIKQRALFTFTQPAEQGQITIGKARIDTSTSARLASWQMVLGSDFIKHPIFGYGVTGYRFLDAQYPRVLAETGLIGLFLFFYLLYAIYRNARESYAKTTDPLFRGLLLGYLAGFWALIAHGIGANTFIIVRIMEPFWFLTAIVIMIPSVQSEDATERTA